MRTQKDRNKRDTQVSVILNEAKRSEVLRQAQDCSQDGERPIRQTQGRPEQMKCVEGRSRTKSHEFLRLEKQPQNDDEREKLAHGVKIITFSEIFG